MNMYLYPEYEVVRDESRCISCRVCERQCANLVHSFDAETGKMSADSAKCVNCHRCVCLCPSHALKIVKSDDTYKVNANWDNQTINEVYKQANSGGVLLSSMGNPKPYPVYWDKMLVNASQVTNPPIDPLREPMETQVYLGKRSVTIERDERGKLKDTLAPQLKLRVPVMFSAMSYGSISYNAHEALARAAEELGTFYNTGEGGLHKDFYRYGKNTIVQVASGRFGVFKDYLENAAAIASGIARSGADIIAIDGYRGGTGAAPTRIRDHVGIPIELALAQVDQRLRDEGIRDEVSLVVGGSVRSSADVVKAIAMGADACYIGTAALLALGCHLCRSCHEGKCNWGIATQRPDLVKRLNPDLGYKRLVNLVTAWDHEIREMMGGMGINSVEALRGNRLMLRGIGLTDAELRILGIRYAGESM